MMGWAYLEVLRMALPETVLAVAAVAVLFLDLNVMRGVDLRSRWTVGAVVAGAGCAIALFLMFQVPVEGVLGRAMLVADALSRTVRAAILVLILFTVVVSIDSSFSEHVGEYLALVLFSGIGMMLLAASENLLMIFVSLELTSLALYVLAGFSRESRASAEAGLKYFLFGGMAAAVALFGLSLVYGLSGSLELRAIGAALKGKGLDPLLVMALVMTLVGFGFKVAAVPFHLWAPDAYEGAPTPSAALIASASKVASFYILAKVLMVGFDGSEGSGAWLAFGPGWVPLVALMAALSMVLGNLAALAQSNVKRLLAYSAIAHAGYALLGVAADSPGGVSALVYYAATYGLTTLGAFGVVAAVEQDRGGASLRDFAGLSRRSPLLALSMMIFLLSLAGIPPLAGFFGKFYVFTAAAARPPTLGLLWLVVLAVAMSAVSLYYYLQVLKQIYVAEAPEGAGRLGTSPAVVVAVLVMAGGVVVLGCLPTLLLDRMTSGGH